MSVDELKTIIKDYDALIVRSSTKVTAEIWERLQQAMTNLTFGLEEKKLPKPEQAFNRNLRAKAIFADPHSDLDQDGQTSLLEAFLSASAHVAEFYKTD